MRIIRSAILSVFLVTCAFGQDAVTLQDALARAKIYSGQVQSASIAVQLAREDRVQARASLLPSLNAFNQFIYTEGNGTPSGVFVSNDGVHVYNEQALIHQDLFNIARRAELRKAFAAEAIALAKRDVSLRGLNGTVVQNFYAIVAAGRKASYAQASLDDAQHFLEITQKQRAGGEAALVDVIKARLQLQQRQRELSDSQVTLEKGKIALAVLIFPDVNHDFTAVDDLDRLPSLDEFASITRTATSSSPELKAAKMTVSQAKEEVSIAKYSVMPSLSLDFAYGIDANQFTNHTDHPTPATGRSTLPDYLVPGRQNLGYSGQVTLNIPIWTWGATHSKIKQAEIRAEQANLDLSLAQRQLQASLLSSYAEAKAAQSQIDSLRSSLDLAEQSLRLTVLRYQAGEGATLEVVDAQTTLAASRIAFVDGLARYRVAIATIQTLTGQF